MISETLHGKNLDLIPIDQTIFPLLKNWLDNSDISKFLSDNECNLDLNKLEKIYPLNENNENSILFSIIEKKLKNPIGICGFQKINWEKKNAFLRIIIGNKNYWDGKTALESEILLLKFAFDSLKLNEVYSIINTKNVGQVMLVERLGMKKSDLLSDYLVKDGNFVDAYKYQIFANEFKI